MLQSNPIILMTFFSQQKKRVNEKLKHSDSAGPGTYSPEKPLSHNNSYAPFGSLLKKQNIVKNENKQPVGPGYYNINRDIIRPSVIQYQNQNCIIIKINQQGNHQFKSKIDRFNNSLVNNTPGPGAYDYFENSKTKRRRTHSVGSTFNKMKQLYSNQYKSKRIPTLTSDKPQIPTDQNKPKQETKGVVRWDLNKKQRFEFGEKQQFNEQNKSILLDKANLQQRKNKLPKQQSSFFASKSIKSCFDQIIYKSSNPFKVQIRKMLGFQDQTPGPGSYEPVLNKDQKKPIKFQFFGSTVNRFSKQEQKQCVGPGDYQVEPIKLQKSTSKPKKVKKVNRKALTQPDQQNHLGPGCYNIEQQTVAKPTFNTKYKKGTADFGSNKPRFEQLQMVKKQQGKSEYISFMAQQDQERKKRIQAQYNLRRAALQNKKHSIFLSQSKRNCFPQAQIAKNSPFAMYEVGMQDIGTKIRKKKQLLQQFASCNLTKPGFASGVQRFKTQKEQPPGHKDCWCQIKQVEKKNIEHMSPAFQSNSLRTQVFQCKNKGPAVGQYNNKQPSFIKQSFNSRFIKQNKNKTKKLKIWKTQQ